MDDKRESEVRMSLVFGNVTHSPPDTHLSSVRDPICICIAQQPILFSHIRWVLVQWFL